MVNMQTKANLTGVNKGVSASSRRGGGGATKKIPKNSTFKPLSTIFVPCIKIQGGEGATLSSTGDAHGCEGNEVAKPEPNF